jgi:hypothetical protein
MSLEAAIQANTEALHALTNLLLASANAGVVPPPAPSAATEPEIEKAEIQTPEDPPAPTHAELADTLRKLVIRISKEKGGEITREALGKFGVSRAQELAPSQYQPAIDHINSILNSQ